MRVLCIYTLSIRGCFALGGSTQNKSPAAAVYMLSSPRRECIHLLFQTVRRYHWKHCETRNNTHEKQVPWWCGLPTWIANLFKGNLPFWGSCYILLSIWVEHKKSKPLDLVMGMRFWKNEWNLKKKKRGNTTVVQWPLPLVRHGRITIMRSAQFFFPAHTYCLGVQAGRFHPPLESRHLKLRNSIYLCSKRCIILTEWHLMPMRFMCPKNDSSVKHCMDFAGFSKFLLISICKWSSPWCLGLSLKRYKPFCLHRSAKCCQQIRCICK